MKEHDLPVVDDQNPLYCPAIPAVSFLNTIRKQLHGTGSSPEDETNALKLSPGSDEHLLPSFTQLLDKSVTADDLLELLYNPAGAEKLSSDSDPIEAQDQTCISDQNNFAILSGLDTASRNENSSAAPETFSDLEGPGKREMSLLSVNEGSFELSAKADRILYFARGSSYSPYHAKHRRHPRQPVRGNLNWKAKVIELQGKVTVLEDELYGTAIGTETPRGLKTLVSRLEILLPGIRLRDKLAQAAGHQEIADVLCLNGCLGTRVLNVLRTSEIEFLDLVPSMAETDGLNLDTHDMLKVFAKSNSFLFLNEINLCGVTLRTSDVMNLHHLPRLARLWLKNTSVGNEAIFLLLPLKRSLLELDVSENLAINDDVVVAFTMLSKLRYLAFAGTSVTMEGIRLLASSLGPHRHDMEVEIPEACKEYLDNMNTKYIVSPDPLLVTDPQIVQSLSTLEIIENLTAHSTINSEIPVEGPRLLLIKQLKEILQTREADLQVRHLLGLE